jgi:hypothetical protein
MIQIHNVEQNSEEWARLRLGIPPASCFSTVLAKGKDGGASTTRRTYLMKLAGEVLTAEPAENYANGHMQRGHEMEGSARDLYAFTRDVEPEQIGFITNHGAGCSPDALVGDNGLLEIKSKLPHLHIEALLRDGIPPEHKAQCQGQLWIAEREWLDLTIYWPKLPLIVRRVYRDEPYIQSLASSIAAFNDELAQMVERVRAAHLAGAAA